MTRSEWTQTLGSIVALVVSYAAAFWLLTITPHDLTPTHRLGWIAALYCTMGVGVFFWARILALAAKKRSWTLRNCRYIPLMTIIPGCVLFLAGGLNFSTFNLLLYQSLFTGALLRKFAFPNADALGPFEREVPPTLFPK
jgi:hypothetical protein